MVERVEKKDKEFDDLLDKWKELSYSAALISAAIEYSKSKESIAKKVENENVAITYGINSINKKVLENPQKYFRFGFVQFCRPLLLPQDILLLET